MRSDHTVRKRARTPSVAASGTAYAAPQPIRYAVGTTVTDAHPVNREAADFEAFARDVLAFKDEAQGAHYICGPMGRGLNGSPHRSAATAEPQRFLPLDADDIPDRRTLVQLRKRLKRYSGFAYETNRSTKTKPRLRAIVELNRPASRDELIRLGAWVASDLERLGVTLDQAVCKPEHAHNVPLANRPRLSFKGKALNVDQALASLEINRTTKGPSIARDATIPAGQRNNTLTSLAGTMHRRGMTATSIAAALLAENAARCAPPLPEAEVRTIARGVVERYEPGTASEPLWPPLLDFKALAVAILPPPQYVIDDLVIAGYLTLLTGHGGTGKTMLALLMAVHIALGRPFCGHPVQRRRVLYLSCEDRAPQIAWRLQNICRYLGVNMADLDSWLDIVCLVGHPTILWDKLPQSHDHLTPAFRVLTDLMKERRTEVLIIDGLNDVFAGNENSKAEAKSFINDLLSLIDPERGAVLLIAHLPKSGDSYSGATTWHNGPRGRLLLSPVVYGKDERPTDKYRLEMHKSNHGALADWLGFRWDPDFRTLVPDESQRQEAADRINEQRMSILKATLVCADRGIDVPPTRSGSRTTALSVLKSTGVLDPAVADAPKLFWEHVDKLLFEGLLIDHDTGKRNPSRRALRALRVADRHVKGVRDAMAMPPKHAAARPAQAPAKKLVQTAAEKGRARAHKLPRSTARAPLVQGGKQ